MGLTSGLTISPNCLLNSREYAMTAVSSIKICFLMKLLVIDTVCNRLEMMFLFMCFSHGWESDAIGSHPLLHLFRTVPLARS